MVKIDTAQKDWQKKMEQSMRNGEKFLLITTDEKLAKSLELGKFNAGILKIILFGSSTAVRAAAASGGISAAAIGTGVLGLDGIASLAGGSALLSIADPELISKIILAIIAGICFILGAYFVYRLIQMLISNKYKFTFKYKDKDQNGDRWEFEAEPT